LEEGENIQVSLGSVEKAIKISDNVMQGMYSTLKEVLLVGEVDRSMEKLMRVIRANADDKGWAKHSEILRDMNATSKQFDAIVETAISREIVKAGVIDGKTKKIRVYRLNDAYQPKPLEEVSIVDATAPTENIGWGVKSGGAVT
jgi:hypothetical protein